MDTFKLDNDQLLQEDLGNNVVVVRINRPAQRNALNSYVRQGLPIAIENAASRGARCVVLTSSGSRSFAAGADLQELSGMDGEGAQAHFVEFNDALDGIEHSTIPVIAAMRGWVLGGGVELAAACDLRIAASTSRFGMPIGRLGHSVDIVNMHRLLSHFSPAFVREMLLADQLFSADEVAAQGFLNRVVPDSSVEDVAVGMAQAVAKGAPLGLRTTRRQISDVLRAGRKELQDADGLDRASRLFETWDFREGVEAFFEKRSPSFRGE